MDPDNRIARHRDESCHHRRIIFSVGPVVARKGVGADKLKIFIFSDGNVRLALKIGCADIISMTQDVNGTIPMIDSSGNKHIWTHEVHNVDGWASLVFHFDNLGRSGETSCVAESGLEYTQFESIPSAERKASLEKIVAQNSWRIVDGSVETLRLLVKHGLLIYRYPFEPTELQNSINTVVSSGLFNCVYNRKPSTITKLSTGKNGNSKRVCSLLNETPFFARFLRDVCRDSPEGSISNFFFNSYDNTIPRYDPLKSDSIGSTTSLSEPRAKRTRFTE